MIVLDTDAALALARGHKALHHLADNVAHTPGDWLHIPSLCLMRAEEKDEGVGRALLALPGIQVDPLGQAAAVTVGGMVRDGWGGVDTCHALYVATPHLETGGMSIILTGREDDYPPGVLAIDIDSPGMLGFH
ncbi:hypothetical protein [Streptomyces caniscabiei]|uniref:Uncharacterized protein n=1 Tax=Streptomyces caniscabiei TaxID=2746961 RepID=A0A927L3K1_9ACTN|nr:hypothetical protein [Streptomyces caniscabiei]MBD9701051.1 hypothetical protein [Streptomyces caniscabiei]MBD9724802.1 hypothetical protein [Streptomyces caniscabiei]MDX3510627.1 hypothetical protein [Streptomyces caniscabiei]MDX3720710.1 hypothetical protein [Streptomyces caniscabiei]MDX3732566.1 hypothetical protein [Streptomyces caniscabiei]